MLTFVVIAICAVILLAAAAFLLRRRATRRAELSDPYQLGLNAMIAGERESAVRLLAAAVREDPRNVDAYIKLGNLLRERGQTRQATQIHRELLVKRRLPRSLRTQIVRSLVEDLVQAGRWREVLEQIQALPRGERAEPVVLRTARDAYENLGELDHALHAHRELLKSHKMGEPSTGVYRAHLGLLALERGDKTRAAAEFLAAVKEDPEHTVVANLYLGDLAMEKEDPGRAAAFWMKIVSDQPDCAYLAFERLERAYFELGDFGRMVRIYEEIAAGAPTNVHALCGISKMLERKGAIDEAIRTAREAIKHEGSTFAGHQRLLEVLVRNERFEEAAREASAFVKRLADEAGPRSCPECGTSLTKADWRCPKCRAWIDAC